MDSNPTLSSGIISLILIGIVFFVIYRAMSKHAQTKMSFRSPQEPSTPWNGNLLDSYRVEWIPRLPTVTFDPSISDHLVAYQLLLGSNGTSKIQCKTLRFTFDPTLHDNVFDMMRDEFVNYYMPPEVKEHASIIYQERFPTRDTNTNSVVVRKNVRSVSNPHKHNVQQIRL